MKRFMSILLSLLPSFVSVAGVYQPAYDPGYVDLFYNKMKQSVVWLAPTMKTNLQLLSDFLKQAPYLGLDQAGYQLPALSSATREDTVTTDRKMTEVAIRFFCDVAYGHFNNPPVKYNGLPVWSDECRDMAGRLADYLLADSFSHFLQQVEPENTSYAVVKRNIARLYTRLTDSNFVEIPVVSLKADTSNMLLLRRLSQLEILDSLRDAGLRQRIIKAQNQFSVLDDGTLRTGFLRELNTPFGSRLNQLNILLNQIRWLYRFRDYTTVVVNIPSTDLVLYHNGNPLLYSRVITGKKGTPTPTLASRITDVVLYPYWIVPGKIATRELLPHIRRDYHYLENNQFDVLDRKGKVIAPSTINWQTLNRKNFPYVLRQNTGCDNSLGIIKLHFYSPFSVYLHDTPGKNLFMLKQRFFSHGCIRVEEAVALARLLLNDSQSAQMDSLILKGCQPDQKPVVLPAVPSAYVFILYNTAWPDKEGRIKFYEDVYGKH